MKPQSHKPEAEDGAPVQVPIDGVLDLHNFLPREIKELVPEYIHECREKGILTVRIIHGKGVGNLRRSVHAILQRSPEVISCATAHPQLGGWGATVATLRPKQA